jgi:hypothetical protein
MSLESDKLNELQEAVLNLNRRIEELDLQLDGYGELYTLASQLDDLEAYLAELNFDEYQPLE